MSNLNINKVIIGGRLTADAELKQTQSGIPVCSFSVAVNRRKSPEGEQKADFINCVAWRATAEFISRYFRKGSSICLAGSIQTRSWTDQEGQTRYATEVVADEAYFVDSKSEAGQNAAAPAQTTAVNPVPYIPASYTNSQTAMQMPAFEAVTDDEDLPF